jgi:hypothetical protein
MYRIVNLIFFVVFGVPSCSEPSGAIQRDREVTGSALSSDTIENTTIEQFDCDDVDAVDLLDELVMHGFDSGKYKISLAIEGRALQRMEGQKISIADVRTVKDVLDGVCGATGTAYKIEDGRILIKNK